MASKKKSAIQARQGHPTGIIDDIARPIIGKAARAALNATNKGTKVGGVRSKIRKAAGNINVENDTRRFQSYQRKAESLYKKDVDDMLAGKKRSAGSIYRSTKKREVLNEKALAVSEGPGGYWDGSPRKMAQSTRKQFKNAKKSAAKKQREIEMREAYKKRMAKKK